jgi:pimeloyl-ACP methyl ester carboxylesterase
LFRPDIFRAVAALSVPHRPRGPLPPLAALHQAGVRTFYWQYFQTAGVAEAELERDVTATMRRLLYSGSGDAPRGGSGDLALVLPEGGGFLDRTVDPPVLPAWLTEADIAVIAGEYQRTGFRGGLSYYRNLDRNWALLAPWDGAKITQPALFLAGTRDVVIANPMGREALADNPRHHADLRATILLEGAGHWVQQERPNEVNAALLNFLREVTL